MNPLLIISQFLLISTACQVPFLIFALVKYRKQSKTDKK